MMKPCKRRCTNTFVTRRAPAQALVAPGGVPLDEEIGEANPLGATLRTRASRRTLNFSSVSRMGWVGASQRTPTRHQRHPAENSITHDTYHAALSVSSAKRAAAADLNPCVARTYDLEAMRQRGTHLQPLYFLFLWPQKSIAVRNHHRRWGGFHSDGFLRWAVYPGL